MKNIEAMNEAKLNVGFFRAHISRIIIVLLVPVFILSGCGVPGNEKDAGGGSTLSIETIDQSAGNIPADIEPVGEKDLAAASAAAAAEAAALDKNSKWVTFLLLCNEGMNNTGGDVGNTLMAVSLNADTGIIRLMMITWDTFVKYEGYDVPQVIDMAYRNGGPEEAVKVFDDNFDMHLDRFMSLNFLNLATLIDTYGGVNVDVSRAERNALNGMVASKTRDLQSRAGQNILSQYFLDKMEGEYHLNEFGPDTHLNGLQAVGYGWLQYDSVYNCCEREIEVVAALFQKISMDIHKQTAFYTDQTGSPDAEENRRTINLDNITEDDREFLTQFLSPIIQTSYNNLTKEEFMDMAIALARSAYMASREGVDIFENMDHTVFPLEVNNPYDNVAGTEGHLVDYNKNGIEMKMFLYKTD